MSKIIVVVGAGLMGTRRIEAFLQLIESGYLHGYSLGICSSNSSVQRGNLSGIEQLEECQVRTRFCPHKEDITLFHDYQDVLDCSDVVGVVLSIPTNLHSIYARQAVCAGKAVLSESPLGLQMRDVIDALEVGEQLLKSRENPLLAVSQLPLFEPVGHSFSQFVTSWRSEGADPLECQVTNLVSLSHRYSSNDYCAQIGSPWLRLAVDDIALALQLFGDPISFDIEPTATLAEGDSQLTLRKSKASLEYDWGCFTIEAGVDPRLTEKSKREYLFQAPNGLVIRSAILGTRHELVTINPMQMLEIESDLDGINTDILPYAREISEFVRGIEKGQCPDMLSPYPAANAVQTALDIEFEALSLVRQH